MSNETIIFTGVSIYLVIMLGIGVYGDSSRHPGIR